MGKEKIGQGHSGKTGSDNIDGLLKSHMELVHERLHIYAKSSTHTLMHTHTCTCTCTHAYIKYSVCTQVYL